MASILSFVPADERTLRLLLTSLCLVAALLVAALVVALLNRWRRQRDSEEDLSPSAQLAHFRSLYEAGTISQEEYERLRAVLGPRVKESLGADLVKAQPGGKPIPPANQTGETPAQPTPAPESDNRGSDGPDTGIRPA